MHHNILTVPLETWHIDVMNIREEQLGLVEWVKSEFGSVEAYTAGLMISAGINNDYKPMSWTVLKDGFPILSGGIYQLTSYMGQAWVMASDDFVKSDLETKRSVVRRIRKELKSNKYTRIQADTEVSFDIGRRFLESLGFQEEGVMKGYSYDGEDCILYGIVKEV